jgi:hypothetical protein
MVACGQVYLPTDAHILNSSDSLGQYDPRAVIADVLRYRKQPLRVVLCEPCGMSSRLNDYMEPKHASDWGRDDPESIMTLFRVSLPLILPSPRQAPGREWYAMILERQRDDTLRVEERDVLGLAASRARPPSYVPHRASSATQYPVAHANDEDLVWYNDQRATNCITLHSQKITGWG